MGSLIRLSLLLGLAWLNAGVIIAPKGFSFSGVSNRFISPNGDSKNDIAIFQFDNPQFSDVTGKIIDMKGMVVATLTPGPVNPSTQLMWDGKAGGGPAPGGVYIYVIAAEGKIFSGTVVVIR